jgi:hypothetical protein
VGEHLCGLPGQLNWLAEGLNCNSRVGCEPLKEVGVGVCVMRPAEGRDLNGRDGSVTLKFKVGIASKVV